MNTLSMDQEYENYLRQLMESGLVSSAEQPNALADILKQQAMPQPRYDIAPMQVNTMRFESGPDAGRVVDMNFAQPPQQPQEKLGAAVEVPGKGKGRYSQDGSKVVGNGWIHDLFPQRTEAERRAKRAEQKFTLDMLRGGADLEKTTFETQQMRQPKERPAPAGYRWRDDSLEPIPGGPAEAKAEKLTDTQGKAMTFGQRAASAHEVLDTIGRSGEVQPGLIKRSAEALPLVGDSLGTMLNWTQDAEQQQVEQAQRNFVNAVLRRESGAVINPSEFDNAAKQYFPQPGDTPQVIEQKRINREIVIQGLAEESGPGMKRVLTAPRKITPEEARAELKRRGKL